MTLKIAIVGGGLGGLAAANALIKYGFEVDIFEQAPALGEVGAGIQISPQAIKALIGCGISRDAIMDAGVPSKGIFTRDLNTGEDFVYFDWRDSADKYGQPFLSAHRADILDALSSGLDTSRIHLGHRLASLEEGADSVTLHFENGASHTADLVVGADGVHSVVRTQLYGADTPKFTGQMVWRALLPASEVPAELLEPSGHIRWSGAGRQFYAYYLRKGEIVSIVTQQETDGWVEENWSLPGDPEEFRASFPDPEPRLEKLMSLVKNCSKWGIFLRAPTMNWGRGRVQLIGDAAHAMLPNAGQGACQAFEDGYILARWLDAEKDPIKALEEFRRVRIPRVHAVQNRSALNASAKRLETTAERKAAFQSGLAASSAMDWILKFEPEQDWDKDLDIPDVVAVKG